MTDSLKGGCQCGRVRYETAVNPEKAYLCHCRMCQRATGGVSIAFVNARQVDVKWTASVPDWYASSVIAERPFCAKCGTPLGFRFNDSDNMDLTVGSFDDPSVFKPASHFGAESMHEAWLDTRDLPRQRADEYGPTVSRWKKAGAEPPG